MQKYSEHNARTEVSKLYTFLRDVEKTSEQFSEWQVI